MYRKLARVVISHELIRRVLSLPENSEIVTITTMDPLKSAFCISCEDFPEIKEGCAIPLINPVMESDGNIIKLKDWGFKKD